MLNEGDKPAPVADLRGGCVCGGRHGAASCRARATAERAQEAHAGLSAHKATAQLQLGVPCLGRRLPGPEREAGVEPRPSPSSAP